MQKEQQELANLIKGKKVAFIGAGVSHKTLIREFVELGAHVTLCDQKKSVEDFGDYAATIKELGIDLSLGENYLDGFKGQDPGLRGLFREAFAGRYGRRHHGHQRGGAVLPVLPLRDRGRDRL